MKKVLLILCAVAVSTGAFAQKKTEAGIKGGLNLARTYSGEGRSKARITGHAGAFAEFYMSYRLGIQLELLYSMQGDRDKEDGVKAVAKLDYINVPFIFKIYMSNRLMSIDLGIQPGYMVSAKAKGKNSEVSATVDMYDAINNKFDIPLVFGMSQKLGMHFDLYWRFALGMIKPIESLENKNMVFSFGAGYRF